MPSKTFMNLDKNKRKKLIDAAMKEFSSVSYPDVSINKIILNAGIPRGSFYMYFKDKEDLFAYLIELNNKMLNETIKNTLVANKGDLQQTFMKLYDEIINKIYIKNYDGIFKNLFVFFHLKKEKNETPKHILFEYVKDSIDISTIKASNTDLEFIFNMFMHNLFLSIVETIKNNNSRDIKEQYLRKLDIICYGVYKEEKNV